MLKRLLLSVLCLSFALVASTVNAEPLTAQMCKDKVEAAVTLLSAEGKAGIAKIKDPAGEFWFGEGQGYIWIHDMEGIMVMHPQKTALDGTSVIEMKDPNGFPLFAAMNELVDEKGAGWVAYAWAKPGEESASPKVSYVKLINVEGTDLVVGSGIYDVTKEDVEQQFPGDAIYEE